MKLLRLVLLSIVYFIALIQCQRLESCIDPNKQNGVCVLLSQCPELSSKITIEEYRRFVSESRCGYGEDKLPRICCERPSQGNTNYFPTNFPIIGVCGVEATVSNRITGGEEAGLLQHPWSVLLINEKRRGRPALFCGGALINTKYVLTAAHCIYEERENELNRISVRLGEHRISQSTDCSATINNTCNQPVDIMVVQKILHHNYHPQSLHNDIGLLKLARAVEYNSFVRPICLPHMTNLHFFDAQNVTFELTGWGKTSNEDTELSDVKHIIRLDGVNNSYCNSQYQSLKPPKSITEKQICAGGNGVVDSCRGDSGSPLVGYAVDTTNMGYYYIAGLSSYGLGKCGTVGWPAVYTKIWPYLDWISQNVKMDEVQRPATTTTTRRIPIRRSNSFQF